MSENPDVICLGIIDPYNTISSENFNELESIIGKPVKAIFVHRKSYWNKEFTKQFSTTKSLATDKKLWKEKIDGIILGYFPTESELRDYTIKALERNLPIFQFSPVLRDHKIAKEIVDLAKIRNKLISCYNPYQYSRAFQEIYDRLKRKEIGKLRFVDLKLYKNDGPNEQWFHNNKILGGGVMSNLGIEFLELALYGLNYPRIEDISIKYSSQGRFLKDYELRAEDFASIEILTTEGCLIKFIVGWNMPIGHKSVIKAEFYGKKGGFCFQNIEDMFMAEKYTKNEKRIIISPTNNSCSSALVHWLWKIQDNSSYNESLTNQLLYRLEIFKSLKFN